MKQNKFIKLATAFLILFFGLLFSSWTMPDQKEHRKQKKLMILCGAYRVGQFGYKSSEDSIQQLYELKLLKEKLEQYKDIDDTAEYYFIIRLILKIDTCIVISTMWVTVYYLYAIMTSHLLMNYSVI